ncbi:MAG: SPOR domain-containing protein [Deltaproteobacteria bacterium]|nr:SPOR domain-containing protein [Deltaproteobacteria bacterium]
MADNPGLLPIQGEQFSEGVAPVKSGSKATYFAVWAGSYLEEAPALKAVNSLQKQGLTSFTVKKSLIEKKIPFFDKPVGDFYLVLAGLFGARVDADVLGRRLKAQGIISNFQVAPIDSPGEQDRFQAQTAPLETHSEVVATATQERSARPLPATSPVRSGEGFKTLIRGRYVGSYRDLLEAREQARRLTESGWPASVEETREGGGMWYRVYLAETQDTRDYLATPEVLQESRTIATRQKGLVILIDSSGLKGVWGMTKPNQARTDASACAGYSQAGRLLMGVERLVSYIPDAPLLMALKSLANTPDAGLISRVTRPVRSLWSDTTSESNQNIATYGLAMYNRPDVLAALRNMKVDIRPASLAPGLLNFPELNSIPGHKTVILFSDFAFTENPEETVGALGQLKGAYGSDLDFIVVYGDTDDKGYQLAQNLSKLGEGTPAWDGCRLLADNSYFEKFVKTVFKR